MIRDSEYLVVHLCQHEDGTYHASVSRKDGEGGREECLSTGYSSSSSCFEEVASLVDAILWSWVAMTDPTMTEGATG